MINVKDLVKDKTVKFVSYRAGHMTYEVIGMDFKFPVPINDVGDATFLAEDKAMLFMRYIRKQVDLINNANEGFKQ